MFDCIFCGKSSAVNLGNERPEGMCADCFNRSKTLKMDRKLKVLDHITKQYGLTAEDAWSAVTVRVNDKVMHSWHYNDGFQRQAALQNLYRFITEYIEMVDRRAALHGEK